MYADRLCVNIELPSEKSLKQLAKNKTFASVLEPMGVIREAIAETYDSRKRLHHVPPFAPAGQSTQLIVGASPESVFDDQTWIIYDASRNYGLCFDRHKTRELRLDITELKAPDNDAEDDEQICQTLWRRYYTVVNVASQNKQT